MYATTTGNTYACEDRGCSMHDKLWRRLGRRKRRMLVLQRMERETTDTTTFVHFERMQIKRIRATHFICPATLIAQFLSPSARLSSCMFGCICMCVCPSVCLAVSLFCVSRCPFVCRLTHMKVNLQ